MKFAFCFPLKVVFAERNLTHRTFEHEGHKITAFDKRNVYFSRDKQKIVYEESNGNGYFIEIDGYLVYLCQELNDEQTKQKLSRIPMGDRTKWANDIAWSIQNPELHAAKGEANLAERQAERAVQEAERKQREAAREAAAEQEYQKSIAQFKDGELIALSDFERMCKENEIKIPPTTLGWMRVNVDTIGKTGLTGRLRTKIPLTICRVLKELKERL